MTYAHVVDVAAPVEMYDALHTEILRQGGAAADGLLVHLARPTAGGFQVIEVWESRSHFELYNYEIVLPTIERMTAEHPGPPARQSVAEFDVHGLVLANRTVVV